MCLGHATTFIEVVTNRIKLVTFSDVTEYAIEFSSTRLIPEVAINSRVDQNKRTLFFTQVCSKMRRITKQSWVQLHVSQVYLSLFPVFPFFFTLLPVLW